MGQIEYIKPNFPADAFAGTATYYARYRVPYPQTPMDDLIHRAGLTENAQMLDIACGPGRVTIPLAAYFQCIWAIDLEPEMIDVGQKEAARQGITNIKWMVGRAEDLECEPDSFQLITIGEAFHRLDQKLIASRALQWLSPGCCLATMGLTRGTEPWLGIVAEIVGKWIRVNAAGNGSAGQKQPGESPAYIELVMKDNGFEEVATYNFAHSHDWTIESIFGYLYSTSFCSKQVLGASFESFEADLKNALLVYDPSGRYHENMTFGYNLGRKPH